MSIAAAVNQTIDRMKAGRIFGYEVFPQYQEAPEAVVRAVNRSVGQGRLKRVEKGRFYRPRKGVLGDIPVSDDARVRDVLYRNGQRWGYITGPALYNLPGSNHADPKDDYGFHEAAPPRPRISGRFESSWCHGGRRSPIRQCRFWNFWMPCAI